jgi:hypothetical protein
LASSRIVNGIFIGVKTMTANEIENNPELQRVLWACYKYWQGESLPPDERAICYSWVVRTYEERFGTRFHHSRLRDLAKLGFLNQDDDSRSGHRRYYKIVEPNLVNDLLNRWNQTR